MSRPPDPLPQPPADPPAAGGPTPCLPDPYLPDPYLPDRRLPSRCLVERADVVGAVAWGALALALVALLGTLAAHLAGPPDAPAPVPRFSTDINAAPAAELALLPGIGPELADRIVADRQLHGPFASAEQLARVHGIGPKKIEQLLPLVICGPPAPLHPPAREHPNDPSVARTEQ